MKMPTRTTPIYRLAYPMYNKAKGIIEAMNKPKCRLPISSLAILKRKLGYRGHFRTIIRMQTPRIRAIFTMFEPNTFPNETPTFAGFDTAKTATLSSGKEVANPTRRKPMVVFPNPVKSEILTEFLIVNSLPTTRKTMETSRTIPLASKPSPSSVAFHLPILLPELH